MRRKEFIRSGMVLGMGQLAPIGTLNSVFEDPFEKKQPPIDPALLDQFETLKEQAKNGSLKFSLNDLGLPSLPEAKFFDKLEMSFQKITVLTASANTLVVKAESKDFLYKSNIFKNDKVIVEGRFTLENNKIDTLLICKLDRDIKKLSSLAGGLSDLLKPLDLIRVNDIAFVFSSYPVSALKSEVFKEFNDRVIEAQAGITLAGFLELSKSGDIGKAVATTLRPFIGDGPYFMNWGLKDLNNVNFSLNITKDIDVLNLFRIKDPKLKIPAKLPLEVEINGDMELSLPFGPKLSTKGGFVYRANEIRASFSADDIVKKIPAPFGYRGVHLSTLTISAAVINGTTTLGAEGDFYIGDTPKKASPAVNGGVSKLRNNQFNFIFDTVPGKITPKFFFLYLDQLTLEDYLKAVSGANVTLPAFCNKIALYEVMMHWTELLEGGEKPDGTRAMPLFGFSAITDIFGLKSFGEVSAGIGSDDFRGHFYFEPIEIGSGLLAIRGNSPGSPAGYKGKTHLRPGGMELSFSSTGKPSYLSFNASASILGLSGGITGEVKDEGITGVMRSDLAGIIKDDLRVIMLQNEFEVSTLIEAKISGFKVSLGPLGNVTLNAALKGDFSASYKNNSYTNSMLLGFEFAGVSFNLGRITTAVSIKDLKNIVQELAQFIRDVLIKELTNEVLKWLLATFNDGIEFVGEKLEEVGKALNVVFIKTLDQAAVLMKSVNYTAMQTGEALQKGYHAAAKDVASALKNAGYVVSDIGFMLQKLYNFGSRAAADLLKNLGYAVNDIGGVLQKTYQLSAEATAGMLREMQYGVGDIGKVLDKTYQLPADVAANMLKQMHYGAGDIGNVLKNVYQKPAEEAARMIKNLGFDQTGVGNVLKDIYNVPAKQVDKMLKGLGFKIKGPKCVLSTAAIQFKGLADDCYELQTLRGFRDEYMLKQDDGQKLVEQYYELSEIILDHHRGSQHEARFFDDIFHQMILPSVRLIERGENKQAFICYSNYVQQLAASLPAEKIKDLYIVIA